jgi:phosphatidylglycerol:prolipoprotein diacylglycerol transferase
MHLYGLIVGLAIIIGINFFEKHNRTLPKNKLTVFELGTVMFAIVGARLYHVIDQWNFYSHNLLLIPQTWNGGMGIFGGIIGALVFIFLYSKFSHISALSIINTITPILPLCQTIGRFANFVNGENPVWWVEAIGNLLIFITINKFPKNPTAKYLIGYGVVRFVTEFWRTETWQINDYKIGQLISIIFVMTGLVLYQYERRQISYNHSQKHLLDS